MARISDDERPTAAAVAAPTQDDPFPGDEPSVQDQIARLKTWYAGAKADAPGGRPVLAAEVVFCDLGGRGGSTFASDLALDTPLESVDLLRACAEYEQQVGRFTGDTSLGAATVCAANRRGPIYNLATISAQPVTKPVVVYGEQSCAGAGYLPATASFFDLLNARRSLEMKLRAVPRDCPSYEESASWVRKVSTEAGLNMGVAELPPMSNACVYRFYVDWDTSVVYMR
jgi:hypothetical protein